MTGSSRPAPGTRLTFPGGLSWTDAGTGEPLLVVRAAGSGEEQWVAEFANLANIFRVIAAEIPEDKNVSPTGEAAPAMRYILDLLGALEISSVNVLAIGSTGRAAVALALTHPERVRRLALFNTRLGSLDESRSRVAGLHCPALFATGVLDPECTPELVDAMAASASRGKALVLHDRRNVFDPARPATYNQALRNLLAEPLSSFDPRELRQAFGSFMTGVTIITTIDSNGFPRGFTANSFTSVSLDPPLLLICIGKKAASHDNFSKAAGFAVNILSEKQKITSGIFASRRPDKFSDVAWHRAPSGNPLIDGSVAWFDCARHDIIDAGDHIIVLGAIRAFAHTDANPLGYARGGYVSLGLEQAAVNAAAEGHTVVGAILECNGKLIMRRDAATGIVHLPEAGSHGRSGSASQLHELLQRNGVETDLGFLFSVFENPTSKIQSIYYRGDAVVHPGSPYELHPFDAIPWKDLPDDAIRIMIKRYSEERLQGRFKVYSGAHQLSELRPLA